MTSYLEMTKEELSEEKERLEAEYKELLEKGKERLCNRSSYSGKEIPFSHPPAGIKRF